MFLSILGVTNADPFPYRPYQYSVWPHKSSPTICAEHVGHPPVCRIKLGGQTTYTKQNTWWKLLKHVYIQRALKPVQPFMPPKSNIAKPCFHPKLLLSWLQNRLQEHMSHGTNTCFPRKCKQVSGTCQANQPPKQCSSRSDMVSLEVPVPAIYFLTRRLIGVGKSIAAGLCANIPFSKDRTGV